MTDVIIEVGLQGVPGQGVPVGGTTGQFLRKASGDNYDTEWVTSSATVASIGDVGDVTLTAPANGDVLVYDNGIWVNQPQGAVSATWGAITGTLSNQTDLQSALNNKADANHNHTGVYSPVGHTHDDRYFTESEVTTLLAGKSDTSHNHDGTYSPVGHNHDATYAPLSHTHAASDITSGTFDNARIAQSNVTQHQAALSITKSQISDLGTPLTSSSSIKDLADVYDSMTPLAGQALIYHATNGWQAETLPSGVTDHGLLSGLSDDDHTQYHNDARGDARYYTQTQIDTTLSGYSLTSHNHTGVYSPVGHTHTASDITDFTTSVDARVTYETLNSNGDVGTGSSQVAAGNHTHSNYQEISTYTVQTTDATPTVLMTVAVPTGQEKLFDVRVHGHEDATNDHIWKKTVFCVKNVGGTASLVGGIDSATGYDAGAGSWTIVVGVSSGNAIVTVTGEAAHTIDWRATLQLD